MHGFGRARPCRTDGRETWRGRLNLEELPPWAQDLIVDTAPGLLEDPDVCAECVGDGIFLVKAHGFTCEVREGAQCVV